MIKIMNGVFERHIPTDEESEVWDVWDHIKWEEMINESVRQKREERLLSTNTEVVETPISETQRTASQLDSQFIAQNSENSFDFRQLSQISPNDRPTTPLEFSPVTRISYDNGFSDVPNTQRVLFDTQVFNATQNNLLHEIKEMFSPDTGSTPDFLGFENRSNNSNNHNITTV